MRLGVLEGTVLANSAMAGLCQVRYAPRLSVPTWRMCYERKHTISLYWRVVLPQHCTPGLTVLIWRMAVPEAYANGTYQRIEDLHAGRRSDVSNGFYDQHLQFWWNEFRKDQVPSPTSKVAHRYPPLPRTQRLGTHV